MAIPSQDFRRQLRLPLLSMVIVLTAMGVGLVRIRLRHDSFRSAQLELAELDTAIHALDAIEWRAIAGRAVDAELRIQVKAIEDEVVPRLVDLEQQAAQAPVLAPIVDAVRVYRAALDEEFGLVRQGDFEAARRTDEERVDPSFAVLASRVQESKAALERITVASGRTVDALLLAFLLIGVGTVSQLYARFERTRRAAARLSVREGVLTGIAADLSDQERARTRELEEKNLALHREIARRCDAEAQVRQLNADLEARVESRTTELQEVSRRLSETSRLAGMADVATAVLHNVGNVLNSVNVSAALVTERIQHSRVDRLTRLAEMLRGHGDDLPAFLASPDGREVPAYLAAVAHALEEDQRFILGEHAALCANVDHIKTIVAMQQSHATVAGALETVPAARLVEDALQMNSASLARHGVTVRAFLDPALQVRVDRHKALQILINLIENAKQAMSADRMRILTVTVGAAGTDGVALAVRDSGAGIAADHLSRIFTPGFTTRTDGHGFGLHNSALAAREMGGRLEVTSDGVGCGSTFTLTVPSSVPAVAGAEVGS